MGRYERNNYPDLGNAQGRWLDLHQRQISPDLVRMMQCLSGIRRRGIHFRHPKLIVKIVIHG